MTKPKATPTPRRWVRTTTVNCPFDGAWVCDVKPDGEKDRWAHRIIVNAPTDAECRKRADIICESLNNEETK